MIGIVIADDNYEFGMMVKGYLDLEEGFTVHALVHDGSEVLEAIQTYAPDLLLLDLVMPKIDGIEVLEALLSFSGKRPKVMLISAFGQEHFVSRTNQLGVDYYLMKPFSLPTLARRIRQIAQSDLNRSSISDYVAKSHYDKVVQFLIRIGMPPHFNGYRYVIDAVLLIIDDKTWLQGITKRLYPYVGQKYGHNAAQVERAIRHAIEVTWSKGNLEELERLFPYLVDASKGKPTNSAFIAKVVDLVELHEVSNNREG